MCDEPNQTCPLRENLSNHNKSSMLPPSSTCTHVQPLTNKSKKSDKKRKASYKILNVKRIRRNFLKKLNIESTTDKELVDKLFDSVVLNKKVRKISSVL
jgi:hypothetical protein